MNRKILFIPITALVIVILIKTIELIKFMSVIQQATVVALILIALCLFQKKKSY
jgi:hypothetical protein